VAAFIALRLRSVLGQRTGHEQRRRRPPFLQTGKDTEAGADERDNRDNIVTLPRREAEAGAAGEVPAGDDKLARLRAADPKFDAAEFIAGAKAAYEMIVTSYAAGDKETLRPLLSRDVFADFAGAIDERAKRGETMQTTFVGMRSAEIVDAQVNGRIAEVTVKFESELISVTKNAQGGVIAGNASAVDQVTDIWTFARDTGSRDPNWTLIATSSPD
jgi:predicted lipid-binding transport protein (Tim44 family)